MVNNLIYDVGMNNGDDTAYYLSKGHNVIAIEANPVLAGRATERFKSEIAAGRLHVLNVGIASEDTTAEFWINEVFDEWSSFDRQLASRGHPHHAVSITCKRLSSVISEHGVPYYLKVDIEGNDLLCVKDLNRSDLPKYISVEFNHMSLLEYLVSLGYSGFKCIDQVSYLPVAAPRGLRYAVNAGVLHTVYRARKYRPLVPFVDLYGQRLLYRVARKSRIDGNWHFNHGASGPFADHLSGRWQSADAVGPAWERECRRRLSSGTPKWFDLHARLADG